MNEAATVKEVVDIDLCNRTYTLQSANVSLAAAAPAPELGALHAALQCQPSTVACPLPSSLCPPALLLQPAGGSGDIGVFSVS